MEPWLLRCLEQNSPKLNGLDRSECLQTPEWPQTPECLQSASPSNSTSGGLNVEWVCRFAVEPITHFASKEGQTSLLRRFTHCLRSPKRLHGRFGQNHENMFCSLFNSCKLLKCEFETKCEFERTFCASFSLKCRRCPRNVLARLE